MTDLTALSDAELLALAKASPAPSAAPKALADMTDDELRAAHKAASPVADAVQTFGSRAAKALIGGPQALMDLPDLPAKFLWWAAEKVLPESAAGEMRGAREAMEKISKPGPVDRVTEKVQALVPTHVPETKAGEYAGTVGDFVGNPVSYLGPGGFATKLLTATTGGVGSEAAGQATAGTKYEDIARLLGGMGGAVGGSVAARGIQNRVAAGTAGSDISRAIGAPVPASAVRRLGASAEADQLTAPGAAARAGELGPETMVLDLGRQLRGRAEAIAAQPGAGQNRVLDAVEGRTGVFGQGTADRVAATLDQEMGQSHNVVDLTQRVERILDNQVRPLYDRVMAAHPVVDVPAAITSRPAVANAMNAAEGLARNYGEQLSQPVQRTVLNAGGVPVTQTVQEPAKTSLRYWDYVKKALDQRIQAYYSSGGASELSSAEKADLGGLQNARTTLVQHLDDVTNGEYANARRVASTKPQLREAMDFGRSAFNSGLLPEEFVHELNQMSLPQQAMVRVGFRRELDRVIEATRNEGATARRILDTNQVRQKIEALYGPQAADEIARRIAAETHFQDVTQDVARNSRTAVRRELIKDTETPSTGAITGVTIPGLIGGAGRAGLNWARGQGMSRTREALGNVLTATGPQRDEIVDAILNYNRRRATGSIMEGARRAASRAGVAQALQDRER